MNRAAQLIAASAAVAALAAPAAVPAATTPVTPAGWAVRPAGLNIGVSKVASGFQGPLGSSVSPDGTRLISASSGAARFQAADLFNLDGAYRADSVPYDARQGQSAFYGTAFSPDGRTAWVAGGGQDVVHVLAVAGDDLREAATVPAGPWPAGLAYGQTPLGPRLYVANNLAGPPVGDFNPPGHTVTVLDPATGALLRTIDLGTPYQPLGVAFERTGAKAYVTQWMGRAVAVLDTATEAKVADVVLSADPLQADHPSAVAANPLRDEVYTANANSDTVSVIDTRTDTVSATIPVGLVRGGPKGAIPDGLAVSPNGATLYVALAGENAVAVVDVRLRRVAGFIPTAWYPTDVDLTPDGRRLVVTNTNDTGAGPNPCGGLSPLSNSPDCQYVARETQQTESMIKGSVQVVRVPVAAATLRALTARVAANNQIRSRARPKPAGARAIRHVVYVIKENRTYDQLFGDLPLGDGAPRLTLFKDDAAPNHRALALRFGVYDRFFADAEVSSDGHNWSTQAHATDYVDKTWPIHYSPSRRANQRGNDFVDVPLLEQFASEPLAGDPAVSRSAASPTRGYLWDNAYEHGVSFRVYGEYSGEPDCTEPPELRRNVSSTTRLRPEYGTLAPTYPGYALDCADHLTREPEWEREFRAYEASGTLPALQIVRLPNDHTRGTTTGAATPQAYVADNDVALGRLVDVVSHSRFWKDTAILVTEDDAQNGPDHVDAHRTLALVISPYSRGGVDSTHYDTASMVATVEELLGLPPMHITDARVARMWALFRRTPDLTPYDARTPSVVPFGDPGTPVNAPGAPLAARSNRWSFAEEDAQPEIALNRAIWKSVKGRHARMPAPRHDRIIGSRPTDEDEDDG